MEVAPQVVAPVGGSTAAIGPDFLSLIMAVLGIVALVMALIGLTLYLRKYFVGWIKYKDREKASLQFVLLQIKAPRGNEIKIDAAEQMFATLASLRKSGGLFEAFKPQPHLSFEIVALHESIRFFISCHKSLQDLVEKQINGAYPDAEIKEVPEYNIFTENGFTAYSSFKLKNADYFPIKTYRDLPTDPLSALTSALGKMQPSEGATVQLIISPADSKWKDKGKSWLKKEKDPGKPDNPKPPPDAKQLEAVETKVSRGGFYATIRLATSSTSKESAKAHLNNMKSAFEQFNGPYNGFTGAKVSSEKGFMTDLIYRYQPKYATPSVLTPDELSTIFHLPNKSIETPHISWLDAKKAPAPEKIPSSGMFIGKSIFRGVTRSIFIGEEDRRRHMYIVGRTGMGKTQLLLAMLLQDIYAGKGVCFIDPHGDAAEDLLQLIPPERAEDVIYFDPSDLQRPFGLNMLEAKSEQEKHFVTASIIGLMYKLFDPNKTGIIGPRFEHGVRNAMLTVMSKPGSTFVEVMRIMTDPEFVRELLPLVQDAVVRRYWTDQIAQTSDFHKSEVLDYTVSKFGRFVTNKMMRNIIGQSYSSFDLRDVMDNGKILIMNLSKGKMGEENSNFLGLILVPKILQAAMSRANMPMDQRRDFYLYVDEFQNFATETFAEILSEARKYRLNLIVANQFIGQIGEELKNAVFGNVGTLIAFRVGVTDANYLQHEFSPIFSERDLVNVEIFNTYVKTIVNGEPVVPFSINTRPDFDKINKMKNLQIAQAIKELSRLKFGRDSVKVEAEIVQRARL
ncbi:type IV secretion system DNA-binding domain-containing protein [Candidatus Daviesbacteria bacterium]|nr:type IV secretion system DNA-binding domain-containing protein [Candidatus Daviesbacteria bacterium]